MKPVAPKERIRAEEIIHLVPAEIKNESAPILMRSFARILVFVQSRAIETSQGPVVSREMGGHPIYDYPDARLMQRVDQELQIIRCSIAARGSVKAGHLVAP